MCGIAGYYNKNAGIDEDVLRTMGSSLKHRGPDEDGIYIDRLLHVGLAHQRLAFLDLSAQGSQPMTSATGNTVVILNGEIYNYLDLRKQLSVGYQFNSNSDTEVILAGFEKWGIDVLNHLEGIFAFVLLDVRSEKLYLVRDRFGVKPLYYFCQNNVFGFASELRSLLTHPDFVKELDRSAVCDYIVYRYVPSPKTIWKTARKLEPATYLEVDLRTGSYHCEEYWKLKSDEKLLSESLFLSETGRLIEDLVVSNTASDVPIGAFLSGGIDSSSVVHFLSKNGFSPETFSLGFKDWPESEHLMAQQVAEHLSVSNLSVVVDGDSFNLIDRMAEVFDEPLADLSVLHTYQLSAFASKHVKGVMGGEGADEAFGGYGWYASLLQQYGQRGLLTRLNPFSKFDLPEHYANALGMGVFDCSGLTRLLHPSMLTDVPQDPYWFFRKHYRTDLPFVKAVQYLDVKTFLGEMVLTKVDRASMANSLEVRVPYVDHRLFEFIFGLRTEVYFRPEKLKFPLHENMKAVLPSTVLNRKKQGFVGPAAFYSDMNLYRQYLQNSILIELGIVTDESVNSALQSEDIWVLWKLLVLDRWAERWLK